MITKWAIGPLAARNLTPKASQKAIREHARRALERLPEMKPLAFERPIRLELDLTLPVHAYVAAGIPGVERVDGRTLACVGADMQEIVRIFRLIINAGLGEHFV